MKTSKRLKNIIFCALIFCVIFIGLINVFVIKNVEFWETSVTSCITILVALLVSYYFSKKNQDEKNQKESYLKVMEKMQNLVNEEYMFKINDQNSIHMILMKKRELNNSVNILKTYSSRFNLDKEIAFVDEKVQEYATFFGNHQDDLKYLKQSELDLKRPLELIDSKLQEAMIKLFE